MKFLKKHKLLISALVLFVVAHCLDIISTEIVMAFVKGSAEANELVRNPVTLKFMALPAVELKLLYFSIVELPFVLAALAVDSDWVGAIPLFYGAYECFQIVGHNFSLFWGR